MTNQNVVAPEPTPVATAGTNPAVVIPYPPPRSAGTGTVISRRKKYYSQLEVAGGRGGGRVGSWVELMKASSPTHAKAVAGLPTSIGGVDDESDGWMMRHPSALVKFEQIMNTAKGKKIVMFLDYDGTLSPIVDDPDSAFMSEQMRAAVRKVASHFPTAIVTGRCLDKVYKFVNLEELYYAGSHGMDIKGPTKKSKHTKAKAKAVLFQPASKYLPCIDAVYLKLLEVTKTIPGAKVENNKFCVSVHFRCVDEKYWSTLVDRVKLILEDYPELHLSPGRKVLEIRPTIKWDKGKALVFLLESLGFANCKDVVPVYIGDDRTDEDAFKVLRDRGQGFGILVSKFPKETNASYSLQEPSEVKDFLLELVKWKQQSSKARLKV